MTSRDPTLTIRTDHFEDLLQELARRGEGVRESGAFLLTPIDTAAGSPRPVTDTAYYDDLDPDCLTGGISFGAIGYSALNRYCRRQGVQVAADIHTHPGPLVRQSRIDRDNPMIALPGHVAIIVPHFAQGRILPTDLGVHVFGGAEGWTSTYGRAVTETLLVEPVSKAPSWTFPIIRRLFRMGERR
ncbi:hypothetical protein BZB76_0059 [Actinomadura pelletieri DSM 43383]|uniref:Uncharacterized protein n=1 Tax=Actinomadura pelletieri DSM 43383 TaxID=1120940 RepID=A0A495QX01_9ACTN|nr:hypothetical protein [Actinomadura pelletieri]RKS78642.1 hypothetical protein BZB76_0059 [Actinomadura pelletieri DSM 43383]